MVRNRRHADPEELKKAVRVYREIQRLLRENAMPGRVPAFYVREKHARRKQALAERDHSRWLRLSAARWTTLYGESPWRVVATSAGVVLVCAAVYALAGGITPSAPGVASVEPVDYLYFSIRTFTTLGYGDYRPAGDVGQALASLQSIVGARLIALLVAVLGRRLMR